MTTLRDRLSELADDAPDGVGAPDPWDRGRREQRVRRAGTAVIVVLAVIALGVTLGSWRLQAAPSPAPATSEATAVLPDRIFEPSPWLPGTDDEGPPGQLVAVLPAERRSWTGSSPGIVGISATTQNYRFLDLPSYGEGAALSPDGRHVAWWTSGTPSGTPNTESGTSITGYAVYDTESGETTRRDVTTEHGLTPADLVWADDDRLVAEYGQHQAGYDGSDIDRGLSSFAVIDSWRPGEQPVRLRGEDVGSVQSTTGDGRVLVRTYAGSRAGFEVIDAVTGRSLATLAPGSHLSADGVVLSPVGRRYAVQPGRSIPARIAVGVVGPQDRRRAVPGTDDIYGLVGWADADTVVAVEGVPNLAEQATLVRIDVDGTRTGSVVLPSSTDWRALSLAAGLLDAPIVPAVEPATPMDPRQVLGLSVGTVLAAGLALVAWRRRRVRLR